MEDLGYLIFEFLVLIFNGLVFYNFIQKIGLFFKGRSQWLGKKKLSVFRQNFLVKFEKGVFERQWDGVGEGQERFGIRIVGSCREGFV